MVTDDGFEKDSSLGALPARLAIRVSAITLGG